MNILYSPIVLVILGTLYFTFYGTYFPLVLLLIPFLEKKYPNWLFHSYSIYLIILGYTLTVSNIYIDTLNLVTYIVIPHIIMLINIIKETKINLLKKYDILILILLLILGFFKIELIGIISIIYLIVLLYDNFSLYSSTLFILFMVLLTGSIFYIYQDILYNNPLFQILTLSGITLLMFLIISIKEMKENQN